MKFGVVNKSTILNRLVLHTLQRNVTQIALMTRKTNIKLGILKGGLGKSCFFFVYKRRPDSIFLHKRTKEPKNQTDCFVLGQRLFLNFSNGKICLKEMKKVARFVF